MAYVKETALIGGRFKLGPAGGRKPTEFVGVVGSAQEQIEQSEIRLPDTTNPLGGTWDSLAKIDRFILNIQFREINSRVLSSLLYADVTEVPSDTITGEEVELAVGMTTALDKMPLTITAVTGPDAEEYQEDEDWRMTGAGIEVLPDSDLATAIEGSVEPFIATVDYTSATFDAVEVLTNSGKEWYLLFEGSNAVGQKGRFNGHYWRVKFQPTESRDVIGVEDFMALPAVCEVLREDSRASAAGDPKSAYARLDKERVVQA